MPPWQFGLVRVTRRLHVPQHHRTLCDWCRLSSIRMAGQPAPFQCGASPREDVLRPCWRRPSISVRFPLGSDHHCPCWQTQLVSAPRAARRRSRACRAAQMMESGPVLCDIPSVKHKRAAPRRPEPQLEGYQYNAPANGGWGARAADRGRGSPAPAPTGWGAPPPPAQTGWGWAESPPAPTGWGIFRVSTSTRLRAVSARNATERPAMA